MPTPLNNEINEFADQLAKLTTKASWALPDHMVIGILQERINFYQNRIEGAHHEGGPIEDYASRYAADAVSEKSIMKDR